MQILFQFKLSLPQWFKQNAPPPGRQLYQCIQSDIMTVDFSIILTASLIHIQIIYLAGGLVDFSRMFIFMKKMTETSASEGLLAGSFLLRDVLVISHNQNSDSDILLYLSVQITLNGLCYTDKS